MRPVKSFSSAAEAALNLLLQAAHGFKFNYSQAILKLENNILL